MRPPTTTPGASTPTRPRRPPHRAAPGSAGTPAADHPAGPRTSRASSDCHGSPCTPPCWERSCQASRDCLRWPSKANWSTRVPGMANWSRRAWTSGVISPRSSAMNGSAPSSLCTALKNCGSRARHPLAGSGGRRPRRYVPRSREPSEMIQANRVDVSQEGAHPVDAPAVAGSPKRVPVVDGIAPELPLGAEVVGWHAGDEARPVMRVQQKQLRVRPHVARVGRDEEGQIADQADALGMGMCLEALRPDGRGGTGRSGSDRPGSSDLGRPARGRRARARRARPATRGSGALSYLALRARNRA